MRNRKSAGFTLTELVVGAGIFGILSVAIVAFLATSTRLVGRNVTTNHSHDSVRASTQRMLAELHSAGSGFTLLKYNGVTYTEVAASPTTNRDQLSQLFLSQSCNGVRFRRMAGGPYPMSQDTTPTNTTVQFDFGGGGGGLPYIPQVNDKVLFPLLDREFLVSAVVSPPTASNGRGTVRLDRPIGFTVDTTGSKITTGMFFRRAAFTVWNGRLRYHPDFDGNTKDTFALVRDNVSSPNPFSLLFTSSTAASSDRLQLRMALECSDSKSSARRYLNGTTTLLSVIPPRNVPTFLSSME